MSLNARTSGGQANLGEEERPVLESRSWPWGACCQLELLPLSVLEPCVVAKEGGMLVTPLVEQVAVDAELASDLSIYIMATARSFDALLCFVWGFFNWAPPCVHI